MQPLHVEGIHSIARRDDYFRRLGGRTRFMYVLTVATKNVIFEGALAVVLADGKVAQDELSLVRVIAISLGLPMPPLISE